MPTLLVQHGETANTELSCPVLPRTERNLFSCISLHLSAHGVIHQLPVCWWHAHPLSPMVIRNSRPHGTPWTQLGWNGFWFSQVRHVRTLTSMTQTGRFKGIDQTTETYFAKDNGEEFKILTENKEEAQKKLDNGAFPANCLPHFELRGQDYEHAGSLCPYCNTDSNRWMQKRWHAGGGWPPALFLPVGLPGSEEPVWFCSLVTWKNQPLGEASTT